MTTHLQSFGQLLTHLPQQFGFVPDRSVVVVGMRGTAVAAVVRLDDDMPGLRPGEDVGGVRSALGRLVSAGAQSFVIIDHRTEIGRIDAEGFAGWVRKHVGPVHHVFVVCGETWWATTCEIGCCDGGLHEFREPRAAGVAPSRTDARRRLEVIHPLKCAAVENALAQQSGPPESCPAVWRSVISGESEAPEAFAQILAACPDPLLRDEFLWTIVPELTGGEQTGGAFADGAAEVLERTLGAVPTSHRSYWLAFLALARWRTGDLPGACLAAEVAFEKDPGLTLARLAIDVVSHGVPYASLAARAAPLGP